jgi:hypothetical protein
MAIKVKHEGNVTSRLTASSAGGTGRRQAEDAARLTQMQTQADIAAQEQASREAMQLSGTAAHLAASGLGRAPGIISAPSGPSGLVHGTGKRSGLNWGSEPYDGSRPEETYTDRQIAEHNRLSDALVKAEQSGDYTPEEMTELRKQVHAKQMGIEPVRIMKRQVYPEGQDSGQTWKLDDGTVVTRNNKGDVVKLVDSPKPDASIAPDKLFEKAFVLAQGEVVDGGTPSMKRVKELMQEIKSVITGEGGDTTGEAGIPFSFVDDMFGFTDIYDKDPKPDLTDPLPDRGGKKDEDPAKKWRVK